MKPSKRAALAALVAISFLASAVQAQEAAIRKNLSERLPQLEKIDEISKTAMPGIFEVRVGGDLFYTDAEANFLLQGQLIDTRRKRNLTEERMNKLLAIDFAALPLKDAFTVVRGTGKRKVAVFGDPNCGYCKRFERDLLNVDNITVHTFLYPILGPDSAVKSRNVWCAKDPGKAWLDWMVRDKAAPEASCDTSALVRNMELGKKHKISGTPTMVFVDGTRVPGAVSPQQIEKHLTEARQ